MSEVWDDLLNSDNESIISVIQELTSDEKIDFTTQIDNPISFSILEIIANNLNRKYKMEDLNVFLLLYKKYMIPYKRQRVGELLKAIIGNEQKEEQSDIKKKLLGDLLQ